MLHEHSRTCCSRSVTELARFRTPNLAVKLTATPFVFLAEVLDNSAGDMRSDMFALGGSCVDIITAGTAFDGLASEKRTLPNHLLTRLKKIFDKNDWDRWCNVFTCMLSDDPKKRKLAKDILKVRSAPSSSLPELMTPL
jgi:hypothetical protein